MYKAQQFDFHAEKLSNPTYSCTGFQEIRSVQLEDCLQECYGGEEMDCSDTDDVDGNSSRKKTKLDGDALKVIFPY